MKLAGELPSTGTLISALSITLLLAGCQETATRTDRPTPAAYAASSVGNAAGSNPESNRQYRILPQDMLEISVFQVPSLNRTVQVDGNGQLFLPLIGGVTAGGRTVREVESDVAARLGAKYVNAPQVSVFVKDAIGQRITVEGAVKRPGVFSANSLVQALAQAGGVDDIGDRDSVTIFRVTGQQRTATRYSLNAIRAGQAADPPTYGGDTVVVGESAVRTVWKDFKDVAGMAGLARMAIP